MYEVNHSDEMKSLKNIASENPETKTCFKCKTSQSIANFYANGCGRIDAWCKACRKIHKKQSYFEQKNRCKDLSHSSECVRQIKEDAGSIQNTLTDNSIKSREDAPKSGDIAIWNRLYGKDLDEIEYREIKANIQRFVDILVEYNCSHH